MGCQNSPGVLPQNVCCVSSPHIPTYMSFFSFSPMTQKQSNLHFPQLYDPPKRGFALQLQRYGFHFHQHSPPKTTTSFVSLSPMAHKKIGFTPLALMHPKQGVSFPWPRRPKNVMCVSNPTRLNKSLENPISYGVVSINQWFQKY